ncbi:MAG: homoserine kinase [Syntrophomonadaceae bacterium]|nr:homoserine kinase [Syntrophomonadaceae bacterium]
MGNRKKIVTVKVPATSANLGPGFDTLGIALNAYLEVKLKLYENDKIIYHGEGQETISLNIKDNYVYKAIRLLFEKAGQNSGVHLEINNNIPVGKGLGSSAAAIVAGFFAANELIDNSFTAEELVNWAVQLEGHADNIIPAVYGGLTTAMIYGDQVYYQKITLPEELQIIVVVPDFNLPTEKSRSVLPAQLNLTDTVSNLQRACFLLASIFNGDLTHINKAMDDMIYQPLRKQFVPGFDEVLTAAKSNGAVGTALSGAGPSIIAFATGKPDGIGEAMKTALLASNIDSRIYYLHPDQKGIHLQTESI